MNRLYIHIGINKNRQKKYGKVKGSFSSSGEKELEIYRVVQPVGDSKLETC